MSAASTTTRASNSRRPIRQTCAAMALSGRIGAIPRTRRASRRRSVPALLDSRTRTDQLGPGRGRPHGPRDPSRTWRVGPARTALDLVERGDELMRRGREPVECGQNVMAVGDVAHAVAVVSETCYARRRHRKGRQPEGARSEVTSSRPHLRNAEATPKALAAAPARASSARRTTPRSRANWSVPPRRSRTFASAGRWPTRRRSA